MQYFRFKDNEHITCMLCKHYCTLKEGNTGICGVNKNEDNKLVNLTYAHPSVINLDPIEKKPLYHFLPSSYSLSLGTVGCNFRCPFCQNHSISQVTDINKTVKYPPQSIVALALKHNAQSISYTYNEPAIWYPYAREIALLAKEEGIKNVFVTSGYESDAVLEDMAGIIDGVNVDLKSFSAKYYKNVLKTSLDGVLDGLKKFVSLGIHTEVTTLVIPGVNDSKEELKAMAQFIMQELGSSIAWHISAFHPDYKMQTTPPTPLKMLLLAKEIAKEAGLEYVYVGNVRNDNSTYCPQCNALLIQRDYFQSKNVALEHGHCKKCNYPIKGVWQ
jgi:pyruvate formate lyase activating enzyme